ncbi:alpha/beta hydrolase [Mucilaginibacter terrenus]|uniref:Alpha/beta hydrolase n=1 Tax=Mucilaginibacter terrenus TaxID=2482727 RepID=A0A3E2NQL0_9SPHI|nr:alpha/beta hydrolase-fold protein [Mucilaginibacter terrenus]RFZ83282.1 alpha/beta hydrolase [Mucilaginibacter terrenus]
MFKSSKIVLLVACILLSFGAKAQNTAADTARIITFKINISQLKRERTIRVYLPAGYASSKKKYPVIYMHDGQNLFSDVKAPYGNWYIDSAMKAVPASKQSIIVGIYHGDKYRITEYSPYDSKYGKAEGDAYLEFMVKTLKPHIDSLYRTLTGVKHTAIIGSSMGGLISMYAIIKYPGVFGTAGVLSPSFWLNPRIYQVAAGVNKKAKIFLSCGDQEGNEVADVMKMDTVLLAGGLTRINVPAPLIIKGAKHNEAQWQQVFVKFYAWLMH